MVEKKNATEAEAGKVASLQKQHPNVRVLEGLLRRDDSSPGTKKTKARKSWFRRLKLRHTMLVGSFALVVAVPTVVASGYLAFIAADQHHSSASFAIRSIESSAAASDILGVFTQASGGSTTSDSYIMMDYIRSSRMLEEVEQAFDLNAIFGRRGADFFYGMASGMPREERLEYWRSMVSVDFDLASGIVNLEIRAFDPQEAHKLAEFVIRRSEALVNELSATAREEVLRSANEELALAEKRLYDARIAVREYRDVSQEIDPGEEAKMTATLIATLEQQLAQMRADLSALKMQMATDSPRVRVLVTKIASVEKQIEFERQRVGSGEAHMPGVAGASPGVGNRDVAGRILAFETLETEREFAERTYTAALTSLEKARLEANGKQRYFALFIPPDASEMAQYPARLFNSLLVFLGFLFAWSIGVMGYYNIRDRS